MEKRFKNWKPPVFDRDGYAYPDEGSANKKEGAYGWRCFHADGLKLGECCDVAAFTLIQAKYGVDIGKDVEIGPHSYICSWSTIDKKTGKVIIRDGAKVGAYSMVMPGITIGKNSIVGAYSFVNRNIPDDVLAFGQPCKVVRKLTDDEIKRSENA